MKAVKFLLIISLLSACVPWIEVYYEAHSAKGTQEHYSSTMSFAKNSILFQQEGLETLVVLSEVMNGADLKIRAFVPDGKVFSVTDSTVLTSKDGKNFDHKYTCKFYRMGKRQPAETLTGYPDKYLFHKSGTYYNCNVYIPGHDVEKITVRLPVFETKSHKPIELSDVTFEKKGTIGISPIN